MKTYNLGSGQLHYKAGDKECFCALGVFATERGIPVEQLDREDYSVFADHMDDLKRMAEALAEAAGSDLRYWASSYECFVYHANDRRDHRAESSDKFGYPFKVPADKIKEALALVGVDVQLNDVRGRELQWARESNSTSE